jgi:hypothetical protein
MFGLRKIMSTGGYVFVLSLLDISARIPCEIIPGHILKRASQDQADTIRSILKSVGSGRVVQPVYDSEVSISLGETSDNRQFDYTPLPPNQWRYWIIEFEGYNEHVKDLQYACSLLHPDVELGFQVFGPSALGGGYALHTQALQTFFNDMEFPHHQPHGLLQDHDVEAIGRYYALWKDLPADFAHIRRAFERFDQLRAVTRRSELYVLGLFSVIESLLTHAPKLSESADSLSHQIKTKFPLVSKRFERSLNHVSAFGSISEENLWPKLYAYRSMIVHGEQADLTGKLHVLGNRSNVVVFLRQAVKLLLIAALKEPVLLTDLKRC